MRNLYSKFFPVILFVCLLLTLPVKQAEASHAMGADISYECIDPVNRVYKITLRFYRDCAGIEAPPSITVTVASLNCGQSIPVTLTREPSQPNPDGGQPGEVSPLCPTSISQSSCNGGNLPGVQAFTYTGTVTLPQNCPDWIFSFNECCRNDQITNLIAPSSADLYVQATLNNSSGQANNSPDFTTLPVPFICANQPFSYNQGAVDADGDSLVYKLVNPLSTGGSPITYSGTFTPANPLTTTPPNSFGFSGSTGQISFTPNGLQVAVVTVLVEEYRNGVLIGTTMRDIQIVVLNIPGCGVPPTFSGAIQNTVQNGFFINPQLVQVCPGSALSFGVLAANSTNDSVFMSSNSNIAIPGSQFTTVHTSSDTVVGSFSWTPTALDTGIHNIIVTVKNKNCPIANVQSYAVTVQVLSGTYAGPDLAYCPAGGPVQLQAFGGTQFTWTPTTGLNNPNIGNPTAAPLQTTDYIVTSNLSSSCKNVDTVKVTVVPDFNFNITQSDDTICRFEYVNFTTTADQQYAPYTYAWTPAVSLNATNISNPSAQPDYTTGYAAAITSNVGCTIKDTLLVVVEGQGPQVTIAADRTKVCQGDTVKLNSQISSLPCGLNVVPCQGTFGIKAIGTGTISEPNATPYHGVFSDGRIQILYRASELKALGMTACTITDIAFDVASSGNATYNDLTVRMGCTNLNSLSTFVQTGLSVVATPSAFVQGGTGFSTHNFTSPYDWDGVSNLVVEVCYNNTGSAATSSAKSTASGFSSVVYASQDNSVGCNLANPLTSNNRPNTQFIYCAEAAKTYTYTWTPTTNLYTPDSLNPFVIVNENTTYVLNANDGSCTGGASVSLSVDTTFGIELGPDVSFCNGQPAQLNAVPKGNIPVGGSLCGVNNSPCTGTPVLRSFNPSGAVSSTITPFDGAFFAALSDERTQILYRASDLLAAGFTAGVFSQIGINIPAKATVFPFQFLNVKLGCTNKNALTAGTWEPTTLVYTNDTYLTIGGWNDFVLQSTFDWDGVSNIVLEICWNNDDGFVSSGGDPVLAAPVTYNSFQTITASAGAGCNLGANSANMYQVVPTLRARVCSAPQVPVTYTWQPTTGLNPSNTGNPFASPQQQTTYVVTAYFGGKCPKTDSITVTPKTFAYTPPADSAYICVGDSTTLTVSGGTYNQWTPATGLSCTNCPSTVASPSADQLYVVSTTDTTTGCILKDSVNVFVLDLVATAWFGDTLVDQATPVNIGATVTGGPASALTYVWTPADYLDNANSLTPQSTPLTDVPYLLTVSAGGCSDTTLVNVRVNVVASPVAMPNGFTPNGDGKNDGFFPVLLNNVAKVKAFRIYNRYGAMVHSSNTAWDGTFNGAAQPAGTYVYYLTIERPLQEDEQFTGSVTLLR